MMEPCKDNQLLFKKKIRINLPLFNFHATGLVKSNLELVKSVQRQYENLK